MTYDDEQNEFIKTAWAAGDSASEIAAQLYSKFNIRVSRSAICGKADRMGLASRDGSGAWSQKAAVKRAATMKLRGSVSGPKPKKAATDALAPSDEPLPLGQPGQNPGECQWIAGDDPKTWVFCGHPKLAGRSYCSHHAQRCLPPKHAAQPPRKHIVMNPDRQFR